MRRYSPLTTALLGLTAAMTVARIIPLLLLGLLLIPAVRSALFDMDAWRVSGANSFSAISAGGNVQSLTENLKRLKQLSAAPGEAGRYNRALNVVVVYSRSASDVWTPPSTEPDEIDLDLRDSGDDGFVVIANGPSVWRIHDAPAGARAKIAFESEAAFDLLDAPPGLLAGFKSGAFGSGAVVTPSDYLDTPNSNRFRMFCFAIQNWAQFFNVPFQDVRIWSYRRSPHMDLRAAQVTARGQQPQWARSISFECNPPPATPQTVFPPLTASRRRR